MEQQNPDLKAARKKKRDDAINHWVAHRRAEMGAPPLILDASDEYRSPHSKTSGLFGMGWLSSFWNDFKESWRMSHQEFLEEAERQNPGAKARIESWARRDAKRREEIHGKSGGYIDPGISQNTANPAVMAQKMYQSGAMNASVARSLGANIASGVHDRRD